MSAMSIALATYTIFSSSHYQPYFMYVPAKAHFNNGHTRNTIFKYNYTCSWLSAIICETINKLWTRIQKKLVGQCLTAVSLTTRSQIGHQVVTQAAPRGGTAEAAFPPPTAIEPGTCVCRGVFSLLLQQLHSLDTNTRAWNLDCYIYPHLSTLQARVCSCSLLFV